MKRVEIDKERRDALLAAIKAHFLDKHDEEIGELKAGLLVDLLVSHVGAVIYNQAIRDAQAHLAGRVEDLDGELWAGEE